MKSKMFLSLVMTAAVTLGGAAMATNANFTASAVSNGNTVTMGTVQIGNDKGEVSQTINMDTLFNVGNLGTLTDPVTQSRSIVIRGTLPVKLSLGTFADNNNRVFQAQAPSGVISTWWRHYKSSVLVTVNRANGKVDSYESRPNGQFDSIFDTIEGTIHNGSDNTTGISQLLDQLGTLYPGDLVTFTTKTKFDQTTYYTSNAQENITAGGSLRIDGNYTLTQEQVDAFQGKSLYVNLKVVATEAK